MYLSEQVGQSLFNCGLCFRTRYYIQHQNRHVNVHVAIYLLHAFCSVSFCNHFHLSTHSLHAYPFPIMVPKVRLRLSCCNLLSGSPKINLSYMFRSMGWTAVRRCISWTAFWHQYRLEVVTILQTATDTCCDGVIRFLQNRRVFYTDNVTGFGLDEFAPENRWRGTRLFVEQPTVRGLKSLKATSSAWKDLRYRPVLVRNIVNLMEIFRANKVLIGTILWWLYCELVADSASWVSWDDSSDRRRVTNTSVSN